MLRSLDARIEIPKYDFVRVLALSDRYVFAATKNNRQNVKYVELDLFWVSDDAVQLSSQSGNARVGSLSQDQQGSVGVPQHAEFIVEDYRIAHREIAPVTSLEFVPDIFLGTAFGGGVEALLENKNSTSTICVSVGYANGGVSFLLLTGVLTESPKETKETREETTFHCILSVCFKENSPVLGLGFHFRNGAETDCVYVCYGDAVYDEETALCKASEKGGKNDRGGLVISFAYVCLQEAARIHVGRCNEAVSKRRSLLSGTKISSDVAFTAHMARLPSSSGALISHSTAESSEVGTNLEGTISFIKCFRTTNKGVRDCIVVCGQQPFIALYEDTSWSDFFDRTSTLGNKTKVGSLLGNIGRTLFRGRTYNPLDPPKSLMFGKNFEEIFPAGMLLQQDAILFDNFVGVSDLVAIRKFDDPNPKAVNCVLSGLSPGRTLISQRNQAKIAVLDNLHRLSLYTLNCTGNVSMKPLQIWKNYKHCQLSFLEDSDAVVLYLPKKGLVEVWKASVGETVNRIAVFNMGAPQSCTLMSVRSVRMVRNPGALDLSSLEINFSEALMLQRTGQTSAEVSARLASFLLTSIFRNREGNQKRLALYGGSNGTHSSISRANASVSSMTSVSSSDLASNRNNSEQKSGGEGYDSAESEEDALEQREHQARFICKSLLEKKVDAKLFDSLPAILANLLPDMQSKKKKKDLFGKDSTGRGVAKRSKHAVLDTVQKRQKYIAGLLTAHLKVNEMLVSEIFQIPDEVSDEEVDFVDVVSEASSVSSQPSTKQESSHQDSMLQQDSTQQVQDGNQGQDGNHGQAVNQGQDVASQDANQNQSQTSTKEPADVQNKGVKDDVKPSEESETDLPSESEDTKTTRVSTPRPLIAGKTHQMLANVKKKKPKERKETAILPRKRQPSSLSSETVRKLLQPSVTAYQMVNAILVKLDVLQLEKDFVDVLKAELQRLQCYVEIYQAHVENWSYLQDLDDYETYRDSSGQRPQKTTSREINEGGMKAQNTNAMRQASAADMARLGMGKVAGPIVDKTPSAVSAQAMPVRVSSCDTDSDSSCVTPMHRAPPNGNVLSPNEFETANTNVPEDVLNNENDRLQNQDGMRNDAARTDGLARCKSMGESETPSEASSASIFGRGTGFTPTESGTELKAMDKSTFKYDSTDEERSDDSGVRLRGRNPNGVSDVVQAGNTGAASIIGAANTGAGQGLRIDSKTAQRFAGKVSCRTLVGRPLLLQKSYLLNKDDSSGDDDGGNSDLIGSYFGFILDALGGLDTTSVVSFDELPNLSLRSLCGLFSDEKKDPNIQRAEPADWYSSLVGTGPEHEYGDGTQSGSLTTSGADVVQQNFVQQNTLSGQFSGRTDRSVNVSDICNTMIKRLIPDYQNMANSNARYKDIEKFDISTRKSVLASLKCFGTLVPHFPDHAAGPGVAPSGFQKHPSNAQPFWSKLENEYSKYDDNYQAESFNRTLSPILDSSEEDDDVIVKKSSNKTEEIVLSYRQFTGLDLSRKSHVRFLFTPLLYDDLLNYEITLKSCVRLFDLSTQSIGLSLFKFIMNLDLDMLLLSLRLPQQCVGRIANPDDQNIAGEEDEEEAGWFGNFAGLLNWYGSPETDLPEEEPAQRVAPPHLPVPINTSLDEIFERRNRNNDGDGPDSRIEGEDEIDRLDRLTREGMLREGVIEDTVLQDGNLRLNDEIGAELIEPDMDRVKPALFTDDSAEEKSVAKVVKVQNLFSENAESSETLAGADAQTRLSPGKKKATAVSFPGWTAPTDENSAETREKLSAIPLFKAQASRPMSVVQQVATQPLVHKYLRNGIVDVRTGGASHFEGLQSVNTKKVETDIRQDTHAGIEVYNYRIARIRQGDQSPLLSAFLHYLSFDAFQRLVVKLPARYATHVWLLLLNLRSLRCIESLPVQAALFHLSENFDLLIKFAVSWSTHYQQALETSAGEKGKPPRQQAATATLPGIVPIPVDMLTMCRFQHGIPVLLASLYDIHCPAVADANEIVPTTNLPGKAVGLPGTTTTISSPAGATSTPIAGPTTDGAAASTKTNVTDNLRTHWANCLTGRLRSQFSCAYFNLGFGLDPLNFLALNSYFKMCTGNSAQIQTNASSSVTFLPDKKTGALVSENGGGATGGLMSFTSYFGFGGATAEPSAVGTFGAVENGNGVAQDQTMMVGTSSATGSNYAPNRKKQITNAFLSEENLANATRSLGFHSSQTILSVELVLWKIWRHTRLSKEQNAVKKSLIQEVITWINVLPAGIIRGGLSYLAFHYFFLELLRDIADRSSTSSKRREATPTPQQGQPQFESPVLETKPKPILKGAAARPLKEATLSSSSESVSDFNRPALNNKTAAETEESDSDSEWFVPPLKITAPEQEKSTKREIAFLNTALALLQIVTHDENRGLKLAGTVSTTPGDMGDAFTGGSAANGNTTINTTNTTENGGTTEERKSSTKQPKKYAIDLDYITKDYLGIECIPSASSGGLLHSSSQKKDHGLMKVQAKINALQQQAPGKNLLDETILALLQKSDRVTKVNNAFNGFNLSACTRLPLFLESHMLQRSKHMVDQDRQWRKQVLAQAMQAELGSNPALVFSPNILEDIEGWSPEEHSDPHGHSSSKGTHVNGSPTGTNGKYSAGVRYEPDTTRSGQQGRGNGDLEGRDSIISDELLNMSAVSPHNQYSIFFLLCLYRNHIFPNLTLLKEVKLILRIIIVLATNKMSFDLFQIFRPYILEILDAMVIPLPAAVDRTSRPQSEKLIPKFLRESARPYSEVADRLRGRRQEFLFLLVEKFQLLSVALNLSVEFDKLSLCSTSRIKHESKSLSILVQLRLLKRFLTTGRDDLVEKLFIDQHCVLLSRNAESLLGLGVDTSTGGGLNSGMGVGFNSKIKSNLSGEDGFRNPNVTATSNSNYNSLLSCAESIISYVMEQRVGLVLTLLCRDSSEMHSMVPLVLQKETLNYYLNDLQLDPEIVSGTGSQWDPLIILRRTSSLLEHPLMASIPILAKIKTVIRALGELGT